MNIGDIARESGLPAKTIRYYEEIRLIRPRRAANGYRHFDAADAARLSFLARARAFGFTIEECRTLIALHDDPERTSSSVKALAAAHLTDIDRKIAELHALRDSLAGLVARCRGDAGPDCAIIDGLAHPAP